MRGIGLVGSRRSDRARRTQPARPVRRDDARARRTATARARRPRGCIAPRSRCAARLRGEPERRGGRAPRRAARQGRAAGWRRPVRAGLARPRRAGLERAVDPNADGDASDALPVALVGVNSPYAGFEDAPEAKAVRAAAGLGTLVVAPAGNEGPGAGTFGTIGSPAAATGALAVGATAARTRAVPRVDVGIASPGRRAIAHGILLGGRLRPMRLGATSPSGRSRASPPGGRDPTGEPPHPDLTVDARPKARRRVGVL